MKVGDIEMDSQNGISFDGGSRTSVPQPQPPAGGDANASIFQRLPDWSRGSYAAVALLTLVAFFACLAGAIMLVGSGTVFWLLPVIPAPGFLFAAALFAWRAVRGARESDAVDTLGQQRSEKLAAHLRGRQSPASVEVLINELGWSEEAVVHGLDAAVQLDLVEEDLDVETGHWTYWAEEAPRGERRKALPIEDRARQLEQAQSK